MPPALPGDVYTPTRESPGESVGLKADGRHGLIATPDVLRVRYDDPMRCIEIIQFQIMKLDHLDGYEYILSPIVGRSTLCTSDRPTHPIGGRDVQ